MGTIERPSVFGVPPLETVGMILFVVWVVKHTLNALFPHVYTNWMMPILAAALGVAYNVLDNPSLPITANFKTGVLLGASAVFLFSLYDNIMRGFHWYRARGTEQAEATAEESAKKTKELAKFIQSVVSYFNPTDKQP